MVFNECPDQDLVRIKIGEVVFSWHMHERHAGKT